jgi:NAD(P)-dependent dehydrogenase (short-subunit alcohol dehydrogenase family)
MVLRKVPAARFGAAHEVAALVTFLVSDAAAYMTGQVVTVDGGYVVS